MLYYYIPHRSTVAKFKAEGRDFSKWLYIPDIDPITGRLIQDRGDHNHLIKRIATALRAGRNHELDLNAWEQAYRHGDVTGNPFITLGPTSGRRGFSS